jgi:hypothetical protein
VAAGADTTTKPPGRDCGKVLASMLVVVAMAVILRLVVEVEAGPLAVVVVVGVDLPATVVEGVEY